MQNKNLFHTAYNSDIYELLYTVHSHTNNFQWIYFKKFKQTFCFEFPIEFPHVIEYLILDFFAEKRKIIFFVCYSLRLWHFVDACVIWFQHQDDGGCHTKKRNKMIQSKQMWKCENIEPDYDVCVVFFCELRKKARVPVTQNSLLVFVVHEPTECDIFEHVYAIVLHLCINWYK